MVVWPHDGAEELCVGGLRQTAAAATLEGALANVHEHKQGEGPTQRSGSTGFNRSILKEMNPEYSLEGLMRKLKLQYFGHLM